MTIVAKKPKVVKKQKAINGVTEGLEGSPAEYVRISRDILNGLLSGEIKSGDADRMQKQIVQACLQNTGLTLEQAGLSRVDPIERLLAQDSIFNIGEAEIDLVSKSIRRIDDLRVSDAKKKTWIDLLSRLKELQREAKADPAKFWVYVGRDSEDNSVFQMEWFHVRYFDIWAGSRNALVMAPPGHGKSTCMRGFMAWMIGTRPNTRMLFITDETKKASQEVRTMRSVVGSKRLLALFPEVRVLGRTDNKEDSAQQFTVSRENILSKDPTFAGYSIQSRINGQGYDMIVGDDFSPPEGREQAYIRKFVTDTWFSVVQERLRPSGLRQAKLVCTPWHQDDAANTIARHAREGRLKDWTVAIKEFAIKDDEQGLAIPLWPKVCDREQLEQKKATMAPGLYGCNYRLKVIENQRMILTKVHFYPSETEGANYDSDKDDHFLRSIDAAERWLSIDPSASSGSASSDTGVVEYAITAHGFVFLTNCWFHHLGPVQMREWVEDRIANAPNPNGTTAANPGYTGIQIEAQGGMKGMVSLWVGDIRQNLSERGYAKADDLIIQETGTRMTDGARQNRSKLQRLSDVASYFQNGWIRMAGRRTTNHTTGERYFEAIPNSSIERLANAMKTFTGTESADGVDAASQWPIVNRQRMTDPNKYKSPHDKPQYSQRVQQMRKALKNLGNEEDSSQKDEEEFYAKLVG